MQPVPNNLEMVPIAELKTGHMPKRRNASYSWVQGVHTCSASRPQGRWTNSRRQSCNSTALTERHMLGGPETDLRRHLGLLIGLRVQPPQGLQIPQILMLRQRAGQVHLLVIAPLGRDDHTTDLLDLGVVWRAHTVQVSGHLQHGAGAA